MENIKKKRIPKLFHLWEIEQSKSYFFTFGKTLFVVFHCLPSSPSLVATPGPTWPGVTRYSTTGRTDVMSKYKPKARVTWPFPLKERTNGTKVTKGTAAGAIPLLDLGHCCQGPQGPCWRGTMETSLGCGAALRRQCLPETRLSRWQNKRDHTSATPHPR